MNNKQKIKLVMFDMDGTLIVGRSIFIISEKKGFKNKLIKVLESNKEAYQKSIEIAKFLKGFDSRELLDIVREIPLQKNTREVAEKLRENSVKTAIATDSYQFIADDLKKRLNFDYAFANNLIIKQNIVTGELILNNNTKKMCHSGKTYSICKGLVLEQLCEKLNIKNKEIIAIGDGIVDIGMIKKAGLGIAYKAPDELQKFADVITNDLGVILEYI
ncbi:MAG: HAD family phosphatase [Thermoplasmatales archaeon]|nr:MAG: HAD family phosphatase [Thermoplasmatales archaeon]